MKTLIFFIILELNAIMLSCSTYPEQCRTLTLIQKRADELETYARQNGYSTRFCFMIDMNIHSGRKRFFVYDMKHDSILYAGLVAHGSCEQDFLKEARFSNKPGGGCTSLGKYKIGYSYYGQYGKAFKLFGLESSNSNAYQRAVVLHGYDCVPNQEIYPKAVCNSMGCPMISYEFLEKISSVINKSEKPVLLWVYR